MNIQQIINQLRTKAVNLPPLNNTLKIDFGGEYIFIDGFNKNAINTQNRAANCTIKVSKMNFLKLMSGRLKPMWGVMSGRIKIIGDKRVLNKLSSLL